MPRPSNVALAALTLLLAACAGPVVRRCTLDDYAGTSALCASAASPLGSSQPLRCASAATEARGAVSNELVAKVEEAVDLAGPSLGRSAPQIRSRLAEVHRRGVTVQGSEVAQRKDAGGSCKVVVILSTEALHESALGLLAEAGVFGREAEAILSRLR
jgi:hypothetical protein